MSYQSAASIYWFKDLNVPSSINMGVHTGDGFCRYYFHDNNSGNFVMFLVSSVDNSDMVFDMEYHWNVAIDKGEFAGRDFVRGIKVPQIMPIIAKIIGAAVEQGFGK